jgi:peptide/nickel transport system substrate-binding protein
MPRLVARTLASIGLGLLVTLSTAMAGQQPRRGGTFNWLLYADPARLDVHTESPLSVQQAVAGIYSGLLQYDPDDPTKIVPDLAERWEVSADGKIYTFFLRKGVKWHDGQPFTAADVKATFDRVLNPDFRSPRCGAMLKPLVAALEVVDPHTVTIQLKFPAAPFVSSIASAWCVIAAKHILERDGDLVQARSQIGTGPFKFKRYERDSVIEWERNSDYYDTRYPYLDGVKQFIIKGKPTQVAAAKAGRLHMWDTWPPLSKTEAMDLKAARGDAIEIYPWPLNTTFLVHMHTEKPPFNQPDLRRAVHLAIDRQHIVERIFEGAGTPCAILDPKLHGDFALPLDEVKQMPGCRQPKDQDLAEAKQLVEKHYPGGLDIEVSVRSVGDYIDRAQLVVDQLRKIGLRGTLKTYESAAGFAVYGRGDFVLIAAQDTAMVLTDPSDPMTLLYTTNAGRNWGKWSDPKVDELAEQGLRETNPEKRKRIYWELQRDLLTRDTPAVTVGWVEGWYFLDKRVQNYKPALTVYDNNTFMKVWLSQ